MTILQRSSIWKEEGEIVVFTWWGHQFTSCSWSLPWGSAQKTSRFSSRQGGEGCIQRGVWGNRSFLILDQEQQNIQWKIGGNVDCYWVSYLEYVHWHCSVQIRVTGWEFLPRCNGVCGISAVPGHRFDPQLRTVGSSDLIHGWRTLCAIG